MDQSEYERLAQVYGEIFRSLSFALAAENVGLVPTANNMRQALRLRHKDGTNFGEIVIGWDTSTKSWLLNYIDDRDSYYLVGEIALRERIRPIYPQWEHQCQDPQHLVIAFCQYYSTHIRPVGEHTPAPTPTPRTRPALTRVK